MVHISLLSRFRWVSILCLLVLVATTSAHAQMEVTAGADSSAVATPRTPTVEDSLRRTAKLFGHRMTVPAKATYLSLMFPGLGQIYNKRYWKLPLGYGAVGGTVYGLVYSQRLYREFKTANLFRNDGNPATQDKGQRSAPLSDSSVDFYLSSFRTQRDQFIGYTAVAYSLNILDALVDAHLRDFDVTDDLSIRLHPTLLPILATINPGVAVSVSFSR